MEKRMTQIHPNLETAPGHEVLATAGKTVLRPGGQQATQQLFRWANFQPSNTVLELASGLGTSAIALAKHYSVQVVGVERDPRRVAIANQRIQASGLADQVQILQGNIFELHTLTEQFDYVLAEAILTMQSPPGKAKILAGICDRLKPGGKFLSHELLVQDHEAEIHHALAAAIRANATPLSLEHWIDTCEQARLHLQRHQAGPMRLLYPPALLQDEDIVNTLKIAWNILTQPKLRSRILAMQKVFQTYRKDLNYLIFTATKLEVEKSHDQFPFSQR
jgi:predicted O-methyltransferase YrrM